MITDIAERIEQFFAVQSDESEFVRHDPSFPYSIVPPPIDSGVMVFTAKPSTVGKAITARGAGASVGLVGGYGLPSHEDASWLRDVVGPRPLWFLGDMDPLDLLIFAWLRARLAPLTVHYLGLCDAYLSALSVAVPATFWIPLSAEEHAALPLLQDVLPDHAQILGLGCVDMLRGGPKLELDAIVSAMHGAQDLLRPLIQN